MKKSLLFVLAIVTILAGLSSCKKKSNSCPTITVIASQLGSVTAAGASATGGVSPYTYKWSTNPSQTSNTATGLTAGTGYSVTVTDHNGCTGSASVTITMGSSSMPTLYDTLGAVVTGAFSPSTGGTVPAGIGCTLMADPASSASSGARIQAGQLALRNVVDSAIFVIALDTISTYFSVLLADVSDSGGTASGGFQNLQQNLTNFLCSSTGALNTGPYAINYAGTSLRFAHSPSQDYRISHSVNINAFNSFINDIVTAAGKCGVSGTSPIISSLGKILGSLQTDIVGQP